MAPFADTIRIVQKLDTWSRGPAEKRHFLLPQNLADSDKVSNRIVFKTLTPAPLHIRRDAVWRRPAAEQIQRSN